MAQTAVGCFLFLISRVFLTDTYEIIVRTDSCRRWESDQCGIGLNAWASERQGEGGEEWERRNERMVDCTLQSAPSQTGR